jgi:hypothetical protein
MAANIAAMASTHATRPLVIGHLPFVIYPAFVIRSFFISPPERVTVLRAQMRSFPGGGFEFLKIFYLPRPQGLGDSGGGFCAAFARANAPARGKDGGHARGARPECLTSKDRDSNNATGNRQQATGGQAKGGRDAALLNGQRPDSTFLPGRLLGVNLAQIATTTEKTGVQRGPC